ncbi:MAG: gliding motility-associated C-terminal domain-containing protein, partial [Bacteroidetes bacterium]|nr:gliding motility-associated C-terminal domain-containing protein [Bacteroidota bacterium]
VPPCPVAHFLTEDNCIDLGIQSTDSSYVLTGTIDTNVWVTDGQTFIDQNTLHHYYSSAGNYPIQRKVRSDRGCWDSVEYRIQVHPLPQAFFTHSDTCFGESTAFTATSTTTTGAPVINRWLIDGNSSNGNSASLIYPSIGVKPVRLIAENAWGCLDTINRTVEIQPLPQIGFTYEDICEGQEAVFTNTTTTKGSLVEQRWSVNDVLSSFGQDYSQTFNIKGNYDIKLVAENNFGCRDSLSQGLVVRARAVANFSIFPDEIYITEPHVNLVETCTDANTWEWELGDFSATEFGPEVFHSYADTGLFSIRLIANNDLNCADTIFKTIRIKPYLRIYIPNAFRPDGDPNNVNSTFKPAGMLYGLKEMTMEIYNRWGEQLYFTDDINRPWDGTFMGKPVKEGTYLYMIKIKDIYNQIAWHQGTVTLIR